MFARMRNYFAQSLGELKKLNLPRREEVINATVVIISFSVLMAIFFGVVDIFSKASTRWVVATAEWAVGGEAPNFFEMLKAMIGIEGKVE